NISNCQMKKLKLKTFLFWITWKVYPIIFGMLLLSSCASMGPKTIPSDGFNYNHHIALQQNEQILLNIVRLRYAEVPLFLNVSSVINQYSRDSRASLSGSNLFGAARADANVNAGWSDRPTITYTPMGGQAFSESLLHPLPPSAVFFLIQSGWSPARMLRLTSSSINGLKNEVSTSRDSHEADADFTALLEEISLLQKKGAFGMEIGGTETAPTVNIHFPEHIADDSVLSSIARFKELLNLNPELNSYPIRYGLIQQNRDEIFMRTHSLLEIFFSISGYVEVPKEHFEEGRTFSTYEPENIPLLRILSSKDRPDIDFVSINTRDYWYYIDDRDMNSKTTFGILQILLSLARDSNPSKGPLISIGN
ncbi:MAG TPA: hypothetical protein VLA03_02465, partial [Draconibacterium sp.]|nr:hypothetical protein [Draconibacterium sp.]